MGCCDGSSADDSLCFILEIVGVFFLGSYFRVGEDVVEDVALAFGYVVWESQWRSCDETGRTRKYLQRCSFSLR